MNSEILRPNWETYKFTCTTMSHKYNRVCSSVALSIWCNFRSRTPLIQIETSTSTHGEGSQWVPFEQGSGVSLTRTVDPLRSVNQVKVSDASGLWTTTGAGTTSGVRVFTCTGVGRSQGPPLAAVLTTAVCLDRRKSTSLPFRRHPFLYFLRLQLDRVKVVVGARSMWSVTRDRPYCFFLFGRVIRHLLLRPTEKKRRPETGLRKKKHSV